MGDNKLFIIYTCRKNCLLYIHVERTSYDNCRYAIWHGKHTEKYNLNYIFAYTGLLHNFYNLGKCGGNQEMYTTLQIYIGIKDKGQIEYIYMIFETLLFFYFLFNLWCFQSTKMEFITV